MSEKASSLQNQLLSQKEESEALKVQKKDEFIKSEEFAGLCSGKELEFFEFGFKGCV